MVLRLRGEAPPLTLPHPLPRFPTWRMLCYNWRPSLGMGHGLSMTRDLSRLPKGRRMWKDAKGICLSNYRAQFFF
jgi:hypothetical protein